MRSDRADLNVGIGRIVTDRSLGRWSLGYATKGRKAGVGVGFSLLPFVVIYFIAGVIMLFFKKSEKFAKGLLLSALILFFLMIFIASGLIHI